MNIEDLAIAYRRAVRYADTYYSDGGSLSGQDKLGQQVDTAYAALHAADPARAEAEYHQMQVRLRQESGG